MYLVAFQIIFNYKDKKQKQTLRLLLPYKMLSGQHNIYNNSFLINFFCAPFDRKNPLDCLGQLLVFDVQPMELDWSA